MLVAGVAGGGRGKRGTGDAELGTGSGERGTGDAGLGTGSAELGTGSGDEKSIDLPLARDEMEA